MIHCSSSYVSFFKLFASPEIILRGIMLSMNHRKKTSNVIHPNSKSNEQKYSQVITNITIQDIFLVRSY